MHNAKSSQAFHVPETSVPAAAQVSAFALHCPASPLESAVLGLVSTSSVSSGLFWSLPGEGRLVDLRSLVGAEPPSGILLPSRKVLLQLVSWFLPL